MKEMYAIVIAFLALWTVSTADIILPVPTKCPLREKDNFTTTNLAHETNCEKFYKCLKTFRIEQDCPYYNKEKKLRLHYNIFEQVCDWPWRAGCVICPKDEELGDDLGISKIAGKKKTTYIKCENGEPSKEIKCKSKKKFSRTCQDCVKNVKGGACDDLESDENPCLYGDRIPHDCNCGKYYECDNEEGDYIVEECEVGLHFSTLTKECTTPDEAKCITKKKTSNFPAILGLLQK